MRQIIIINGFLFLTINGFIDINLMIIIVSPCIIWVGLFYITWILVEIVQEVENNLGEMQRSSSRPPWP
jgi:hypothetical protein